MLIVTDIINHKYSKADFIFFWGHTDRQGDGVGKQWYLSPHDTSADTNKVKFMSVTNHRVMIAYL